MSKSIFSFLALVVVVGCGHTSGSETEDGLLRVYPQLAPTTNERTAAPVAKAEPAAVAVVEPAPAAVVESVPAAAAPAPLVEETPSSLAVRVKGAKRCRVRVGNERFGKAPFEDKPVPPGTHRVYVKCPRRPIYSEVIDFYPGESKRLFLKKAHFKRRGRVARN